MNFFHATSQTQIQPEDNSQSIELYVSSILRASGASTSHSSCATSSTLQPTAAGTLTSQLCLTAPPSLPAKVQDSVQNIQPYVSSILRASGASNSHSSGATSSTLQPTAAGTLTSHLCLPAPPSLPAKVQDSVQNNKPYVSSTPRATKASTSHSSGATSSTLQPTAAGKPIMLYQP